ncbi:MAG: YhfC family intramembrane metalloprotease [Saccharofermentans sp.]|nr:YhfC family intramembrane metalloprotease [Saccharofermentans sp.]
MENMEFGTVSTGSLLLILLTAVLGIALPLVAAIIWCKKKHEQFTTVLIGAATFMLFAIVIEKPLQALLIMPTSLGLSEHSVSAFVNANPVLWGIIVGLFPGVFEETGRFVAFKTLLRKRTQRETGLTHGIGHGGFEAMFILGITYVEYFVFGLMINMGSFFELMIEPVKDTLTPEVTEQINAIVNQITTFNAGTMGLSLLDRLIAVLFHIGASIMVFYAVKDKKKIWLYPLAIVIHTAIDGFLGLQLAGVFEMSDMANEIIFAVEALAVFFAAFFLLYKKDKPKEEKSVTV